MHTDLMRASRRNGYMKKGHAAQALGSRNSGYGGPGTTRTRRHLLTMNGIAPDGGIDSTPGLDEAPDERNVFLLDLAIVKLTRELGVGSVVFGNHHQA
jgi:hypothetical protein